MNEIQEILNDPDLDTFTVEDDGLLHVIESYGSVIKIILAGEIAHGLLEQCKLDNLLSVDEEKPPIEDFLESEKVVLVKAPQSLKNNEVLVLYYDRAVRILIKGYPC